MNKEEVLVKLGQENPVTIRETIFSLKPAGNHIPDEVIGKLVGFLDHRDKGVQSAAYDILRTCQNETVVRNVIPKISAMDLSLRNTAMSILQDLGVVSLEPLFQEMEKSDDVDELIQYLVCIGGIKSKKGTETLIKFCGHEDPNVKSTAIEAMGKIGDPASVPTLIHLFEKEPDIRYTIAEALGRIGSEEGFGLLSESLESEDVLLYFSTIQALGYFRSEQSLPPLVEQMKTAEDSTKRIVLKSLYEIEMALPGCLKKYGEDDGFVDSLLSLESGLNKEEETYFATILASIHSPRVLDSLLGLLESENGDLRTIAKSGLKECGDSIKSQLLSKLESTNIATVSEALDLLANLNDSGIVGSLKTLVNNPNSEIRRILAKLLGNLGGDEAKEILKYFSRDTDEVVRMNVVEAMGKTNDKDLVADALVPLFNDANGHVRRISLLSAGKLGAEGIIPKLMEVVRNEPYGDVREAAVCVLAQMKDNNVTTDLLKLLDSENDRIRDAVAKEIHRTQSPLVADGLVRHLKDTEWRVVLSALASLGKLKVNSSIQDIINIFKNEDWQLRMGVLDALTNFNSPEAKRLFISATHDTNPFVAQKAIQALGSYSDEEIRKSLCSNLKSEHEIVRYQSAKGLSKYLTDKVDETKQALVNQIRVEKSSGVMAAILHTLKTLKSDVFLNDTTIIGSCFDSPDPILHVAIIEYLASFNVLEGIQEAVVLRFEGSPWLKNYFIEKFQYTGDKAILSPLEKACSNFEKRSLSTGGKNPGDFSSRSSFLSLSRLISEKTGLNFGNQTILFRQLNKELQKHYFGSFEDYYFFLQYCPDALTRKAYDAMYDTITNPSTKFFDEKEQLKALAETIIPEIINLKQKDGNGDCTIRILSAGCSFGPEPYSLGMALGEKHFDKVAFEIQGVDISHICLNTAKRGIYKPEMFKNIERKYIEEYTEDDRGDLRIVDEIKNLVQFQFLNLNDPIATSDLQNFDVIICRNLLGRMSLPARQRLAENLYSALNPNGVLFIGSSESLHDATKAFRLVNYGNTVVYKKA